VGVCVRLFVVNLFHPFQMVWHCFRPFIHSYILQSLVPVEVIPWTLAVIALLCESQLLSDWMSSYYLSKGCNYTEQKCKCNMRQFERFYWVKVHIRKSANSLGPNLWISHDWEYRYASVGHRYLKGRGGSENQSVTSVTTICLMQCDFSFALSWSGGWLWPVEYCPA
jgi:hypothetical protein